MIELTKAFSDLLIKSFDSVPDEKNFKLFYTIDKNKEAIGTAVKKAEKYYNAAPSKEFMENFNPKDEQKLKERFQQLVNNQFLGNKVIAFEPKPLEKDINETYTIGNALALCFINRGDESEGTEKISLEKDTLFNYNRLIDAFWEEEFPAEFRDKIVSNIFLFHDYFMNEVARNEAYTDFIDNVENKRKYLSLLFSKKDENNNPVFDDGGSILIKDQDGFSREVETNTAENREIIARYEEFINEEVELPFYLFKEDEIPDMNKKAVKAIMPFIK